MLLNNLRIRTICISVDDNLHLIAEISKTNPYLNEPITVQLYFSNNIGISNFKEVSNPKYNDFWSQNMAIKTVLEEEGTYKGEALLLYCA
jgi:hypothetical protein